MLLKHYIIQCIQLQYIFHCPWGALLLCTLHRSIIWGAIFQQIIEGVALQMWGDVPLCSWSRMTRLNAFFFHGKHCFSTVIPMGLTPPALLTSVIPAPPQGSDLCNQRLVPRMHCVSKALVDWYDHILPETIESLELDFPLVRSSLSYPKTGFGFL